MSIKLGIVPNHEDERMKRATQSKVGQSELHVAGLHIGVFMG